MNELFDYIKERNESDKLPEIIKFRQKITKMKKSNKMIKMLTKGLLWNMNKKLLNWKEDKNIIIWRIIEAGLKRDEIIMYCLYDYEDIKHIAINMDNLEMEIVEYWAKKLNIDKKLFRSYSEKPWYLRTIKEDHEKMERDLARMELGLII
ncbi:MAG: hypothetical protein LBI14_03880 [Treponema sp.]|jgi:hypothetical protein|nr:hypothetical protein [Treponema sp.]